MPTQAEIVRTIAGFPHCSNVRSVTVVLGGLPYTGARYTYEAPAPGLKRPTHSEERFYLLGEPPEHDRVAFALEGEPREWYVASWATEQTVRDPRYREFHPLGVWFGLHEWTSEHAIDHNEPFPYTRTQGSVIYA